MTVVEVMKHKDSKELVESSGNILAWYGDFDIDRTHRFISRCICGSIPRLEREGPGWIVKCQKCGNEGIGSKKRWQAVLNWNKAPVSEMPDWRELPLFNLDRFNSPGDARNYLKGVRKVLENRLAEAREKSKRPGKRPPGKKYVRNLIGYLAWCIYVQGVCKYWDKKSKENIRVG